jgi:predicted ATPase
VGRESELASLMQTLTDGAGGRGSVVFIEGEAGTGKSFLVQALQDQASKLPGAGKIRFAYGSCYEETGGQNAYQPFVEMLATLLAARGSAAGLGKLFLSIVKETGGDWLNMIPGVGPAITASIKTTMIAGQWLVDREEKQSQQSEALSNQYVQTIAKIAPRFAPLVMLIEDAHWIDDASCRLLLRLALKVQSQPLVILVTYRPSYLFEGHPLRKTRNELRIKNLLKAIPLTGLSESEIETYILRRFGISLNPRLAGWLVYLCKGHPLFMTQYLSLLEQDEIVRSVDGRYILDGDIRHVAGEWELAGRLTAASVPDSMEALLEQRIERLVEEDKEMLQLGAVQGEYFMSLVLAGLLKKDEPDILRRLRKVIEQHHLISLYSGEDIDKSHSDVYVFEHALLQQAFYNKLSPRERVLYHRSIAEQLERTSLGQKQPSRKLILEIAHHYDLGEVPKSAADFYQLAAQSLLADGATVEATEISKRALRNIRQVGNADRQHAEILELFLTATRWRDPSQDPEELTSLVEEAEAVSIRTGDKALLARVKYMHGMRISRTGNLSQWLMALREALDLMRQAGDRVGEFFVMSQLGQEMRSENFEAGFALQQEAYQLFLDHIAATQEQLSPALKRQLSIIQNLLGLAKFDRGDYGDALQLLEASITGFRQIQLKDGLAEGLNHLAQLYLSLGCFEQAEAAVKEALDAVKDDESPHYYTSYNRSLLGKVYLEWEHPELAVEPMLQGWQESQLSTSRVLLPLVKNYYAELLMNSAYPDRNLMEADRLLAANVEEARASGYHRSSIAALSLRCLVALANDQIEAAVGYSSQAVDYLEKMGTLPALRTEEVLFNHYRVLRAAGKEAEGRPYLEQAYAVLQKKAASISEDAYRKSFLERVPLSRAIVSAM